ncbi:hypothetical protein GQ43DRAFT_163094 [Delitschia confertaspora ATCC 74209]|uniref:Uncharacterized protein n=1 Tax=Delitschia confertaspora ATCC 74209 TaxID=1513339 RepID=A0A9P4MML2_9PLEO|nr:hypothetical protein GQ43DRAFT_163094 [Delitschia confertaspora ATCC 74209]
MAVRDPAFWRRFSVAVHQDEEAQANRPDLKHTDSWLERQRQKESRRACMCWVFWLCFIAVIAGVVIAMLYLKSRGII